MNKLFVLLLSLALLVSFWFSFKAAVALKDYASLGASAKATVLEWQVKELPSSFLVEARYAYVINGQSFEAISILSKAPFPNSYAASAAIEQLSKEPWTVWYNKKNPKVSSLQKLFPFKACIHAILTIAVGIYFFLLRHMMLRKFRFQTC